MIDANTSRLFLAWRKETRRNGNPTYTPRQAWNLAKRGNEPMPRNSRFLSHHDVIRVRDKAGNRRSFVIIHDDDTDTGPPWEQSEGHGPVSDWTSRDKRPGEIVLNEQRGQKRYYDFQEAMKQARRDGWNAKPYDVPGETKGQKAEKAVKADYEFLRQWCNDEWNYIGVTVAELPRDEFVSVSGLDYEAIQQWRNQSLCGIESCADEYLETVAHELVSDLL